MHLALLSYDPLDLDKHSTASTHAELKSLVWREQSHWLLLMAVPFVLLLSGRSRSTDALTHWWSCTQCSDFEDQPDNLLCPARHGCR